jgi:hypothetical protein
VEEVPKEQIKDIGLDDIMHPLVLDNEHTQDITSVIHASPK